MSLITTLAASIRTSVPGPAGSGTSMLATRPGSTTARAFIPLSSEPESLSCAKIDELILGDRPFCGRAAQGVRGPLQRHALRIADVPVLFARVHQYDRGAILDRILAVGP